MAKHVPATPSGPKPIGPYSIVNEANGFVFISGQVAIDPDGDRPVDGDIQAQTRRTMDNLGAVLGDLGLGFHDVVKTTVFLADMQQFPQFNDVYAGYFGEGPPARSTIQAAALPGGFLVEVEAIAAR